MSIDTTDLLTDKALCTGRDDTIINFDRFSYKNIYGKQPPYTKGRETRVLTRFLSGENLKVKEVLQKIEDDDVPSTWKVMIAVMKEKEAKISNARCFCKLVYEMRLYQTSTERNIASRVFPYVRHQTMTMDERELLNTLSAMTAPFGTNRSDYAFICLDYSRWCLSMTPPACTPLFVELDALFGMRRVFAYSQAFPYECLVVLQDRFKPPLFEGDEPVESLRAQRSMTRWMEGMHQKGWTLLTQCAILAAAEVRGTAATLLGQGDNQIIVLELPSPSSLSRLRQTASSFVHAFVSDLSARSTDLGLLLKPEETWVSTVLFEYGKTYHFQGAAVSNSLKRASRIASDSNDGIQSFSNRISSIFSAGMSVAGADTSPEMAYLLALIEAAETIQGEYKLAGPRLSALLCVPSCLGSLPVLLFGSYRSGDIWMTSVIQFLGFDLCLNMILSCSNWLND